MKKTNTKENNEIIEIPAEEAPYALPDGWKWSWVNNATVRIKRGKSPKYVEKSDYPVFAQKCNQKDGTIAMEKALFLNPDMANRLNDCDFLFDRDIIVNSTGTGTLGRVGFYRSCFSLPYVKVMPDSHVTVVRASEQTYNEYLYYFLKSKQNYLELQGAGSTNQKELRSESISNMPIPLPPLETQKRIVDRIESLFAKLDEAKEKAQTALDTFELRKSAILHKAFTGELTAKWREENRAVAVTSEHSDNLTSAPTEGSNGVTSYSEDSNNVTPSSVEYPNNLISVPSSPSMNEADSDSVEESLPNSWRRIKFGEIGILERGRSKHRPRNEPKLFGGPYPFIQTGDIASSEMYIVEHSQTLSEFGMQQSRMFPKGTLCITIAANIGKVAILSYDCCFPDSVVGFTPNEQTFSEYIFYMMSTIQKELEANAPATAQKNINLQILKDLPISLPPLPEQQEIVRILDDLLAKENAAKEAAEAVIEKIDLMKKSILARAFRGEL